MSNVAKWYVVHTYSGYENKVATTLQKTVDNRKLQDWIAEIRVPTMTEIESKDGKEREVERKIFPGYVLIKMVLTDESWYIVRNTRGVTGFVGTATKPIPLTDKEVEALGVEGERKRVSVDYAVGDTVSIIEGSLEGFVGTVDSIDEENGTVRVIVSMFGRNTPADVELYQVKLAE